MVKIEKIKANINGPYDYKTDGLVTEDLCFDKNYGL